MLYLVQQLGRDWLQTREQRPKCCMFCNFESRANTVDPPFLLYRMQHLLTHSKNSAVSTR
nr:hypothetical protein [Paenibacillus ginsengihumi]